MEGFQEDKHEQTLLQNEYVKLPRMDDAALEHYYTAIANTNTLKSLDLNNYSLFAEDNAITGAGLVRLCEAMQRNTSLTSVSVSSSRVESDVHCISQLLKTRQDLKELVITNIQHSDDDCVTFSNALKSHRSLTSLTLNYVRLTANSCGILCEGLKANKSVKFLNLDNCDLDDGAVESVAALLANNYVIQKVSMHPYSASGSAVAKLLWRVADENDMLTYLNVGPKPTPPPTGKGLGKGGFRNYRLAVKEHEISQLEEKLQQNYSLLYLNYDSAFSNNTPTIAINAVLMRNANYQKQLRADLTVVMNNIARNCSYLANGTLPREVWINVFKFLHVSGYGSCESIAKLIISKSFQLA